MCFCCALMVNEYDEINAWKLYRTFIQLWTIYGYRLNLVIYFILKRAYLLRKSFKKKHFYVS